MLRQRENQTLASLRHDHPMIVSIESAASAQSVTPDQMMLRKAFPVTGSPLSGHLSTSCLPYGFYYDTDEMIEPYDCLLSRSCNFMDQDWVMDDISPADDHCLTLKHCRLFNQTRDSGPTLAQLNLTDNFDLEDFWSSPSVQETTTCFANNNPNNNRLPLEPLNQQHQQSQFHRQEFERTALPTRPPINNKTASLTPKSEKNLAKKKNNQQPVTTLAPGVTRTQIHSPSFPHQESQTTTTTQVIEVRQEPEHKSAGIPPACKIEPSPDNHVTVSDGRETKRTVMISDPDPHNIILSKRVIHSSDVTSAATVATTTATTGTEVTGEKIMKNESNANNEKSAQQSSTSSSPCKSSRVRNSSMCTEGSVSSHDEGFASQVEEESDDEEDDMDSDDESFYGDYEAKDLLGASTSDDDNNRWALNMGRSRKGGQQRFFWQYNVQSKGPKGNKLTSMNPIAISSADPHVLAEAKDPVFSPECRVEGVKHAGKARRGDGNDLTPNPKKLLMIGLELKKLSRIINELTPVSDVPINARNRTRKEKNKLASRACRLKKKAQHEANKIKLFGLQQEHRKTLLLLNEIRKAVHQSLESSTDSEQYRFTDCIEQVKSRQGKVIRVAGRTSDFVNSVSQCFVLRIFDEHISFHVTFRFWTTFLPVKRTVDCQTFKQAVQVDRVLVRCCFVRKHTQKKELTVIMVE